MRVVASDEALRRLTPADGELNPLAVIQDLEFSSGVIEAEIAGEPGPGAAEGARGFVGIAFRMQKDAKTYDAFYLRPTNGRADDQVRRNHSTAVHLASSVDLAAAAQGDAGKIRGVRGPGAGRVDEDQD